MMYTDHRYKTPDTATLESGCLLFGPHTIHYREQHVVTRYLRVCQSIIRALEVLPMLAKWWALAVFHTKYEACWYRPGDNIKKIQSSGDEITLDKVAGFKRMITMKGVLIADLY